VVWLLKRLWRSFNKILSYSDKWPAVRRYFFSNSFDGILAMMGLSLGATIYSSIEPLTVVFAGFGVAVGMLVSGVSGIYVTEKAETKRRMMELRNSMLQDVSNTVIGRAGTLGTLITSLIGGLSTFFISLTVLIPYFIALRDSSVKPFAPFFSTVIALSLLFLLGLTLGSFSQSEMLKSGLRMLGIGLVAALIILMIELFVA